MEYLLTYGWAILIVIVVVSALYVMGVFKGDPTLLERPDYEAVCRIVCESKGLRYYDWYGDPVCRCFHPCENITINESNYELCDYYIGDNKYLRFKIENITEIEHLEYCELECGC